MKPTILSKAIRSGRRFSRQHELTWRYVLNLGPSTAYALRGKPPSGEAARVLEVLNRDGVAITSVDALLDRQSCYPELVQETEQRLRANAEQLEQDRQAAEKPNGQKQKPFMHFLLGQNPAVDARSVYARIALEEPITAIVNSYMGMYCSLCAYNVWYNFVSTRPAIQSQLWHRDPEDRYILKVFICLSDVDEGCGPFTYAPGTHQKGALKRQPSYLYKDGITPRSDDRQMAKVVPEDQWVKGLGKKGTIIFADTRGFHKGGLVRERERILYIAEFLSQAAGRGVSTGARGKA